MAEQAALAKSIAIREDLERKRIEGSINFQRSMADLQHKTMIEQHKLEQLQKQLVLEEEKFALQKLMDEQFQERALLNKIRRK